MVPAWRKKPHLFLALDQGGHGSRAMAFDINGELQAAAHAQIATQYPGPGRVEHDPAALLTSVTRVCKSVGRQLGLRCEHVKAVGLATQRSTVVCWDRETGNALSPVISWQDQRAAKQVARLVQHQARIHDITGLVLSPHYGASKLAWCLDKLRSVRTALRQERLAAGPLASFILTNLLVETPCLTDPVNASRTLVWDCRRHDWSEEMLQMFQIPLQILPHCVPNRYPFGHLWLGRRAVPLTVTMGDQPAALFAGGEPDADSIYINLGTGAFIQRLQGQAPPQVPGMLSSVLWQEQDRVIHVLEGTVNGAGSAFSWLRERLGVSEKMMLANMPAWLAAESDVPLFLNGVSGIGSPYWLSSFRSRFIGNGNAMQKMIAVAESIVFLLNVNLERMGSTLKPAQRIVVSGGLAQWDGLCQRLADLSGLPAYRPALHEATASGLAWLLGARRRRPLASTVFLPKNGLQLKRRYASWLAAMETAQP